MASAGGGTALTYEAAIPASIAERAVSLPAAVLADAEEASNEITRFVAELGDEIARFAAVLLRSESAASSHIENLTASARAIAEAEALGDTSRRNAAVIVSNTEAMTAAVALAGRLDDKAILAMHAALMRHSDPVSAGHWRTEQVWIGGGNFGPRGADFIAPHHTRVPGAVDDLLTFSRRADVPSLPQIAIAHAQFETIRRQRSDRPRTDPSDAAPQKTHSPDHRPGLGRAPHRHQCLLRRPRLVSRR